MKKFAVMLCAGMIALFVNSAFSQSDKMLQEKMNQVNRGLKGSQFDNGGRTGGDNIANAIPISSLPFSVTGNTCGFANDYFQNCDWAVNYDFAPDMVFKYKPHFNMNISVSCCGTIALPYGFDTYLYIFENDENTLIACKDDAFLPECHPWDSQLDNVHLTGGNTYYIVLDGYNTACGDFQMEITHGGLGIPVSDWALYLGIGLIISFAVIRFRRIM
jgi:hypothetical protein